VKKNVRHPRELACRHSGAIVFYLLLSLLALIAASAFGQDSQSQPPSAPEPESSEIKPEEPLTTMFPHSQTKRWWISGQDNIIFQWKPSFHALYSGPNSLHAHAEDATSHVGTLYTGLELTKTTEIFVDFEEAAGGGLSDALGLAGFANLDVVRNPSLGKAPYLSRGMIRQIVPLSGEMVEEERNPWYLATRVPVRRLEFRFGKMGVNDFFDINEAGSDSHFQFLNWTADNNGAYDYAADTRGYSVMLLGEYHDRYWTFRFGEALMPTVANGIDLQWNLSKARAENYELELHPKVAGQRGTTVRLLTFVNHANMGVYRDAINDYLAGKTKVPDITAHPERTTVKYGFGLNLLQQINPALRLFGRFGWNEGQHESYAYTEVDQTFEIGADHTGDRWKRKLDKVGAVLISNAIKSDHQRYLQLGGKGFLLGDGGLNYGRETIEEAYYNVHVWRGLFMAPDYQHINNPGYNRDRGPADVFSWRFHMEF
jgi:high affinity Mn2+ porin